MLIQRRKKEKKLVKLSADKKALLKSLASLGEMVEESKPWQGKNSTHWHLGIGRRGLMTDKFWLAWNSNQALQLSARPRNRFTLSSPDCKAELYTELIKKYIKNRELIDRLFCKIFHNLLIQIVITFQMCTFENFDHLADI